MVPLSTGTSVPKPRVSGMDVSDSALLATLLSEAPIGFAFVGADLRFRRVNQTLASLYGIDTGDYIGRLPSQVWPEDMGTRAESAARHVLEADEPVHDADEPVVAGEQARHWAFSWIPSHDPDGDITGVVLIAVDITDRRNSEEALRRSEERYRSLVQAGGQVVWVTTPTGKIAEDSPEWRWITGQTVDEYLGSGWLDAIHPEDRDRVEREWLDCVDTGKIFDSRYRVRTKSGSHRHYDVRAVPIERDGKINEWVGASTDVTGQREAEEMRGRLTEQLSAAALRTVRLQQATSMLAEAITVEQVVEVITEVGRSAIGAERSAVGMLDPERLNPEALDAMRLGATTRAVLARHRKAEGLRQPRQAVHHCGVESAAVQRIAQLRRTFDAQRRDAVPQIRQYEVDRLNRAVDLLGDDDGCVGGILDAFFDDDRPQAQDGPAGGRCGDPQYHQRRNDDCAHGTHLGHRKVSGCSRWRTAPRTGKLHPVVIRYTK